MQTRMQPGLEYILQLFCNDKSLDAVYNSTPENVRGVQISPIEGMVLSVLIKAANIKSIVEIGSLCGYSTVCMARALPKDGIIYSIDISAERCDLARKNHISTGLDHKIRQIHGDAKTALPELEGPFDAIFIDGDKGGYCHYLDWAERKIRPGGLILADNTLLFGSMHMDQPPAGVSERSWHEMRKFNYRMSDKTKYDAIILPIFDGLMVANKII